MPATRWLLGITGGIAAYKTPELVRLLKKKGKEVQVVLSATAARFVAPLSLEAVSGRTVYGPDPQETMVHITLARWAEQILIAPLTANRLAALAHGFADDLLTTVCLASKAPITLVPAMNPAMWHHPSVQANLRLLEARGAHLLEPALGEHACGEWGYGRMLEPQQIVDSLCEPSSSLLQDYQILITAGPTREAIDPVRFISNHSSGKMGIALAMAAAELGAQVTLLLGPVPIPDRLKQIPTLKILSVGSAHELDQAVETYAPHATWFISTAAVSDYRPEQAFPVKQKKNLSTPWHLTLVPTKDILSHIAKNYPRLFCVGFAAETDHLLERARQKLQEKKVDAIVLNDVSRQDIGFHAEDNEVIVLTQQKQFFLEKAPKSQIAHRLLLIFNELYHAKNTSQMS